MKSISDLPELEGFGSPGWQDDPDGILSRGLSRGRLARSPRGIEVLSYTACETALLDPAFVPAIFRIMHEVHRVVKEKPNVQRERAVMSLLGTEGETHTRLRKAVSPWFTPRRVAGMRVRARRYVDALFDEVCAAGRTDWMSEVGLLIPSMVFTWMIGAPDVDSRRIAKWSREVTRAFNADSEDGPRIQRSMRELHAYTAELLATKRARPDDGLISHIVEASREGLIDDSSVGTVMQELLSASTDNTSHAIGIMLWLLARHPDQWRLLKSDRSLISRAVEEGMRVAPRVRSTSLTNPGPTQLDGVDLPADTMVHLQLASANRDPAVYPDPARFDVTRVHERPQLDFGVGRHYCLGAALARMEIEVVVEAALERWARIELDGEPRIEWADHAVVRFLPLRFEAR